MLQKSAHGGLRLIFKPLFGREGQPEYHPPKLEYPKLQRWSMFA